MANQATLDFIRRHAGSDVRQLALQGKKAPEVDLPFALDQIEGRQKARHKLPSWAATEGIVYPPHLAMEQCSSEATAQYKARVAKRLMRDCDTPGMVDLTGGFGVDFAFMAREFEKACYVERQESLCAISSENFRLLGLKAEVVNADGAMFLQTLGHTGLIFLDPARRDAHGGRTYGMADCSPNVLELKDDLLSRAAYVLVKLSPMLDWQKTISDLGSVSEVHIVSVDNECKELLLVLKGNHARHSALASLPVTCVNLSTGRKEEVFEFDGLTPPPSSSVSGLPTAGHYLFEPNASIMKAGCFGWIGHRYDAAQLGRNSHLFTASADRPDFPGRRFLIEKTTSLNKRELKENLSGIRQANMAVRNFPLSVAELRKRLKLKDGGDIFIFATTTEEKGHLLLICRKIG